MGPAPGHRALSYASRATRCTMLVDNILRKTVRDSLFSLRQKWVRWLPKREYDTVFEKALVSSCHTT
jgi:hypothetical protein